MDLSKRQLLQDALARAEAHHAFIAVSTPSGSRILLHPDFTCYETYVEGTDPDGQLLTLTYEQIASVDVE
jgi:hypothetical protein